MRTRRWRRWVAGALVVLLLVVGGLHLRARMMAQRARMEVAAMLDVPIGRVVWLDPPVLRPPRYMRVLTEGGTADAARAIFHNGALYAISLPAASPLQRWRSSRRLDKHEAASVAREAAAVVSGVSLQTSRAAAIETWRGREGWSVTVCGPRTDTLVRSVVVSLDAYGTVHHMIFSATGL